MRLRKFLGEVVGLLVVLMIAAHLLVPLMLRRIINHRLERIPGYEGHVDAVSLGWLSPSLAVHRITLVKRELQAPGARVSADQIEAHFDVMQLLRRRLILTLTLEKPNVLCLMRERRVGQPHPTGIWRKPFEHVPPFRVDRITFHDGTLRFKNDDALPPIDIFFSDVNLTAMAIANRRELAGERTVHVEGRARMQNHAPLWLALDVKPFREHAEFDIRGTLNDFNLPVMNDIMRYYTGLELEKGQLNMRLNLAIQGGSFKGQVQRVIDHLTIKKTGHGLLKTVKEDVAQAWLDWHEDPKTDRLEKEFVYAGPLGTLDQDVVLAAVWVAKGAFIQSLKANLPEQIHPVPPEQALDEWAEFQAKQRKKAGRLD